MCFLRRIILFPICFMALFLGGCVTTPSPDINEAVIVLKLVDGFDKPRQLGSTEQPFKGVCTIEIRKDVYPDCVTHEIMHCFSGDWHGDRESDDYCYIR